MTSDVPDPEVKRLRREQIIKDNKPKTNVLDILVFGLFVFCCFLYTLHLVNIYLGYKGEDKIYAPFPTWLMLVYVASILYLWIRKKKLIEDPGVKRKYARLFVLFFGATFLWYYVTTHQQPSTIKTTDKLAKKESNTAGTFRPQGTFIPPQAKTNPEPSPTPESGENQSPGEMTAEQKENAATAADDSTFNDSLYDSMSAMPQKSFIIVEKLDSPHNASLYPSTTTLVFYALTTSMVNEEQETQRYSNIRRSIIEKLKQKMEVDIINKYLALKEKNKQDYASKTISFKEFDQQNKELDKGKIKELIDIENQAENIYFKNYAQ